MPAGAESAKPRQECRGGRHKCPRHNGPDIRYSRSCLVKLALGEPMLRDHTVIPSPATGPARFHQGDEVKLIRGTYQGTTGVFLHVNLDPKWGEIREWDCQVRSHPMEWMELVRH